MMDWSGIRHFSPSTDPNLLCRHCGECHMDKAFMELLDSIRATLGKPIIVNSGYRCPEYNDEVSNTGFDGPHTTGKAVDVSVRGEDAGDLFAIAWNAGITGIGVDQKGDFAGRYLHLDTVPNSPGRPRPWVWSY